MRLHSHARAAILLIAICLPFAATASGQGAFVLLNERNHPELQWQEIRTDHFRIFFHEPLEPWARDAASILERFHGPLCRRLDVIPSRRTRVYLSDQDQIANGMAVGRDYFLVWIPSHSASRVFAGERNWFEEVLIHEYAHILVAYASRTWLGNLADLIGKAPPRWLNEGIAQWTAESWNVLRGDVTISAAILDEGLARWPNDGRLLYAQGNARVRWMAATLGDSTIPRLIRPYGSLRLYDYGAAERRALGKRREGLYPRYRREMIGFYGERYRLGENPDSMGVRAKTGLFAAQQVSEGLAGVSWWTGQSSSRRPESSLFRNEGARPPTRAVAGGVTGKAAPLPDGRVLLPRWHRTSHGSIVQDLGVWSRWNGFRFLTYGERIVEVADLGRDQFAAIEDSPSGSKLIRSDHPTPGGLVTAETLFRWPRGWMVHSLAVSPDEDRLIVSATEPDGRRGIWGLRIGHLAADTLRLTTGSAEARGSVWLDSLRLAWTSHEGGLSQVHTGRWPREGRLEADSSRTSLGTGADLIGRLGDSLLVADRTSRESAPIVRLDPDRRPRRALSRPVYLFPASPAVQPAARDAGIIGPRPYHPLSEVRSWLQLPLIGPQAGRAGVGWFGFWAEPLLHHALLGYVYTNRSLASNPDRMITYFTTRFGPWVALHHSSALLPRRLLDERVLWERRETTGLAAATPLHREADPNLSAWMDGFLRTTGHRPRFGGRALSTPLGPPRSWSSLEAGGGIGFIAAPPHGMTSLGIRDGYGMSIRLKKGLAAWKGSQDFAKGSVEGFASAELSVPARPFLWFEGGLRGASRNVPPQEFEGLDHDPSSRLLSGWPGLDGAVFLRGWPVARAARFVLHGSLELRCPVLPDLGFRGPGVAIQGGTIAPFLDAGHPWGDPSASFSRERTRLTYGFEMRFLSRIGPLRALPALAWGHPIGDSDHHGSWSWRITTPTPFAFPFQPPRALRSLLGGQLQDDAVAIVR